MFFVCSVNRPVRATKVPRIPESSLFFCIISDATSHVTPFLVIEAIVFNPTYPSFIDSTVYTHSLFLAF